VTPVLLLALMLAQQATPQEKCAISGTVIDSVTGLPLGKVEIVAEHVTGNDPGASTTTDAKGNFLLVDLDPGAYRVYAARGGYDVAHFGRAVVTLAAGRIIAGMRIRMTPNGVIAGTIRDSDGDVLVGANVELYSLQHRLGHRQIELVAQLFADDLGRYRFFDLRQGRYYVSADVRAPGSKPTVDHSVRSEGPPQVPIRTFYPVVTDPANASPIEVRPGGRNEGADIAIRRGRVYTVNVHVDAPKGLRGRSRLEYSLYGFASIGESGASESGDLKIAGIPPGSYNLKFGAEAPGKPFDGTIDMTQGSPFCENTIPVSVADADLNLRLAATGQCPQIGGHIRIEGDNPPHLTGRVFSFRSSDGEFDAFPRADGSFRARLSSGHYTLDFSEAAEQHDLYVKSIRSGNQDALLDGVTISGSESAEVEVVLAMDGGRVSGTVSDKDDRIVAGAAVALIPNDPALRARFDFTKNTVTDQAGHFELKGLAPGDYKLFAWADIEEDSWFDPDILKDFEAKGQPMSVKVKDSQTANLRVIE
jgi:hypothetical protein